MPEFLQELRRRNVVRAAVSYLVASWALLQMLDMLSNVVGYPDWTVSFVLVLLALLFPIVLLLSWVYEITPEGLKLESEIEDSERSPLLAQRFNIIIILLLIVAIGLTAFGWFSQRADAVPTVNVDKSIAVLPFSSFSSAEEDRHFAHGLSDTLLHKLAQVSDLKVISRTSSFQYEGDAVDVRAVGEALNVATVLEGSVQRSGNSLRIIAQLVRTDDGSHIWSKTFDVLADDIFQAQDDIAQTVLETIQAGEKEELRAGIGTTSFEAYSLHTLVSERLQKQTTFGQTPEAFQAAMEQELQLLDEVLELDPEYSAAYRTKVDIYNQLAFQSPDRLDYEYFVREGKRAALKALAIAPDDPANLAAYGQILRRDGQLESAEVFLRLAFEDLPNDTGIMSNLVLTLMNLGKDPEEALDLITRANEREPNNAFLVRQMGFVYMQLGRISEAAELYESHIGKTDEQQMLAHDIVTMRSSMLGEHLKALESIIEVSGRVNVSDVLHGGWFELFMNLGMEEEATRHAALIQSDGIRARFERDLDRSFNRAQRSDLIERPDMSDRARASLCFRTRRYECVIASYLEDYPELDTRRGRSIELGSFDATGAAISMAIALRHLGEDARADILVDAVGQFYEKRRALRADDNLGPRLALYLSLAGDQDAAIAQLEKLIYRPGDQFHPLGPMDTPAFDQIKKHPSFESLMDEYERRRLATAEAVRARLAEITD